VKLARSQPPGNGHRQTPPRDVRKRVERTDGGERMAAVAETQNERARHACRANRRGALAAIAQDLDDPICVGIRKRAQQDAVDDGGDNGGRCDPQPERQEHGEGEGTIL
jgi:hypothetical protein